MARKTLFRFWLAAVFALLLACTPASGPQKTLNGLARALDDNDSAAFLSGVEMAAYSQNHMRNLAANDPALRALGSLGKIFRLGSMDSLLASALDINAKLEAEFRRGVSTGELAARCRSAETPDCPWVPQALREAKVVELSPEAAIAKVTTPARLTSWLALHKVGERWLVVGHAALENTAKSYALAYGKQPSQEDGQGQPAPDKRQQPQEDAEGVTAI